MIKSEAAGEYKSGNEDEGSRNQVTAAVPAGLFSLCLRKRSYTLNCHLLFILPTWSSTAALLK
jgi:hypothetical protein